MKGIILAGESSTRFYPFTNGEGQAVSAGIQQADAL